MATNSNNLAGTGLNVMTVHRTSSKIEKPNSARVDKAIKELDVQISKLVALEQRGRSRISERHVYNTLLKAVDTGEVDLIVVEDVTRLSRNPLRVSFFLETCVEAGVRVIAVNDCIDTAERSWKTALTVAFSALEMRRNAYRHRKAASE